MQSQANWIHQGNIRNRTWLLRKTNPCLVIVKHRTKWRVLLEPMLETDMKKILFAVIVGVCAFLFIPLLGAIRR